MSTISSLWTGSKIMLSSSGYSILVTEQLSNGYYLAQIIVSCELGYAVSTQVLVPGNQAIWTAI